MNQTTPTRPQNGRTSARRSEKGIAQPAAKPVSGPAAGSAVPVAIIGVACRLPGAPDVDSYWRLLAEGRDAVTEVPADRFSRDDFYHPRKGEPGRSYTFSAGVLPDPLGFDAPAFGISPREAAEIDPQQRLILELAAEAVENAGWPLSRIAGTDTGVYVGASTTDFSDVRLADPASADRYFMTGTALSIVANRVGNVFDLHGPVQTIDTACSSALVALHQACQALATGTIPTALVGGVNMLLSPYPFAGFSKAGMLSQRGRCQAFDARADGYVRAEGGGMVLLKRLDQAQADGDTIHAVILGTGSNAAGRTMGLSLPNQAAQQKLITQVLTRAGIEPERVAYFEAHGTGTAVGDPIEVGAIAGATASADRTAKQKLWVGSAKTNVGHTEAASGMVGLIKAMLVLQNRVIPPSLHFETPNPNIDFEGLKLAVPTEAVPLPGGARAVVGVNSFGFGGTNASVMLTAAPAPRKTAGAPASEALPPLLLSARSAGALQALAGRWEATLRKTMPTQLPALLRGAALRRDFYSHRLALRGASPDALISTLGAWRAGQKPAEASHNATARPGKLAFVFSGNGAQWAGMAKEAMATNATFRAAVAEADAALRPLVGWSATELLADGVAAEIVAATDHAQPLLFAVQLGVTAALAEQGITPDIVLGHSVGEVAAAYVSGLLDLPTAARLIVARSKHQQLTRGLGRMAALGASEAEAAPVVAECGLEIAAVNGPAALTIAGPAEGLDALEAACKQRRWTLIRLDLDYAFHSRAMDVVKEGLLADLAGLHPQPHSLPMLSTVTAEELTEEACSPAYWWHNLRDPVHFHQAVQKAASLGARVFVEIGPHAVLQSYVRDTLRGAQIDGTTLGSLSKRDGAGDPFPGIADRAFAAGADPRQGPAFQGEAASALPATPFDRQRITPPHTAEAEAMTTASHDHMLLGFRRGHDMTQWSQILDTTLQPWLADHKLAGDAVLPAAGMAEMALAAANLRFPEAAALELSELQILRPLTLEAERSREVRTLLSEDGQFRLESRRRLQEESWTLHAHGRIAGVSRLPEAPPLPPLAGVAVTGESLVALAAERGLDYGPAFNPVVQVEAEAASGMAVVTLKRPASAPADSAFLLHPVRLDGALQGMIGLLAQLPQPTDQGLVPVRFARLTVKRGDAVATRAEIRLTARGERSVSADLVLRDAAGGTVAVLQGCWLQRIRLPGRQPVLDAAFKVALLPALPAPTEASEPVSDLAAAIAAGLEADASASLADPSLLLEGFCSAATHAVLSAAARGLDDTQPYSRALLQPLANEGMAEREASGWVAQESPLPPAADIWQQVLLEEPALAHELAWLAAAAERLPDALAGVPQQPSPPPAEALGFDHMAAALAAAAARFAAAWPAERPLRVLEVGAGGALTAHLPAALAASGRRVLYTAAAPADGKATAITPQQGVEFHIELWDPLGEAPAPVAADLVVGLARGALSGVGPALAQALQRAVAPGGALLLAEPTPGRLLDFVCGQDPAWWQAATPRGTPLGSLAEWEAALAEFGWESVSATALESAPFPAALLAARSAAAPAVVVAPAARRIALFAEPATLGLRSTLAAALEARGASVTLGLMGETPAPRSLAGALVVALPAQDDATQPLAETLASMVRLAEASQGAALGFRLITRGGAQNEGAHPPAAAAVHAAARVLANEMPELRARRIDVAVELDDVSAARRLAEELLAEAEAEPEVSLALKGRLVPRLAPGVEHPMVPSGASRLQVRQPGQLASLHWAPFTPPVPGEGEVLLKVQAAGLNFRDLMWAQGLLPEEALLDGYAGATLGMECAGVVEAAGPGTRFRPGDRVFGIAPAAFATHALTREAALALLPEGIAPEAAASVPVAFLTTVYALETLADIQPGETVLVHGGAGAVGLSALQVARARGARVIATAGSEAKRAFLRLAGVELVLDSRDLGFAEALRAHYPEGVDVVLNSLAGDAMERSLALLKPFGRFLELGKRDYYEDRRMGMRPLRRNIAYHGVDVDTLPRARPQLAADLLAGIRDRMEAGIFTPLPHAVLAPEVAENAFRRLQASKQIGKLILRPPAGAVLAAPVLAGAIPQEGTVLVVGGLQGFGLECARFLAQQGVRSLALMGRRGMATPGVEAALAGFAEAGVATRVLACDATDTPALEAALAEIRTAGPLTGVVHAAARFDDGAAIAMTAERFAGVLAPKLAGALALDRLTAADPLELFLVFSSATTAFGNPGQVNYVAANAGLEALATSRHAAGRPGLAVGWGPIADAGVLANDTEVSETLRRRMGVDAFAAQEALSALPTLLAGHEPVVHLARVAWATARMALPVLSEPMFAASALAATAGGEEEGLEAADLRQKLRNAGPDAAQPMLRQLIAGELARILRLPVEAVATDAPVAGLGLDSLGGLELRMGLEQRLGVQVPLASVTEDLTIDILARRLTEVVCEDQSDAAVAAMVARYEPDAPSGAEVERAA